MFASSVAIGFLVVWWVVEAESSPFHDYFLYHVQLGNILARLSLPAVFVGICVSGNVHAPSEVGTIIAMFVQWFLIGWFVSIPALMILAPSRDAR